MTDKEQFANQVDAWSNDITDLLSQPATESEVVLRLRQELETGLEELKVAKELLTAEVESAVHQMEVSADDPPLNLAAIAFAETDTNGVILRSNENFAELVGRRIDFLVGKPIVILLADDERTRFRSLLHRAANAEVVSSRVQVARRDGGRIQSLISGSPIPSDRSVLRWVFKTDETIDTDSIVADLQFELEALSAGAHLSASLVSDHQPLGSILQRLADLALEMLRAEAVTVDFLTNAKMKERGVSGSERLTDFSAKQFKRRNGPSWDAYQEVEPIRTDSVKVDSRWIPIHSEARNADVGAVQALPLELAGRVYGVITAYRPTAMPFNNLDEANLKTLASHAVTVIANKRAYEDLQREADNLAIAIESRGVIERAKGMVMMAERCTEDEAFERLKKISQSSNLKLRDLAENLVSKMSGQTKET